MRIGAPPHRLPVGRLLLAAALVVSACSADPGTSAATPASPQATEATAATATAQPTFRAPATDAFGTLVREVTGDFDPSQGELNRMWQQIFASTQVDGQQPYSPPTGVAPYRSGEVPPIACARNVPARDWPRGAFYCPADGWIVYDETWLREFSELRDISLELDSEFVPAAVLAHEWGHHVASLFGQTQYDVQDELQADCFAGMFLAYRELPPGAQTVNPQSDEFSAAIASFFLLANRNYSESSWFQADEHGSSFQRMLAFGTGSLPLDRGLSWCYGYRDFIIADFAQVGPYRLVNLPGRSEDWDGERYVIAPEERVSDPSSQIALEWLPARPIANAPADFEQLAALAAARPGFGELVGPGVALTKDLVLGSGWFALYEGDSRSDDPRSGILAIVAPESDRGALVIDVSRPGGGPQEPAPGATLDAATLDIFAEQVGALYQVMARLCGPDQGDELDSEWWSMACLDQQ